MSLNLLRGTTSLSKGTSGKRRKPTLQGPDGLFSVIAEAVSYRPTVNRTVVRVDHTPLGGDTYETEAHEVAAQARIDRRRSI